MQQNRKIRTFPSDIISWTPGANLNIIGNLVDIFDDINTGLLSGDGVSVVIDEITIKLHLTQIASNETFVIIPFIAQTAGTLTTTSGLANDQITEVIDGVCDDEFGLELLHNDFIMSRVGERDFDSDTHHQVLSYSTKVPKRLLNLINKEQQTERLQNIYFGLHLVAHQNVSIAGNIWRQYKYRERIKGITIR